ncbi:MAG: efflux RND transporter periplasmic adaptor subunit [Gemmataceae bacterium]
MRRIMLTNALCAFGFCLVSAGCTKEGEAKKQAAAPPVIIANPIEREVVDRAFFTGNMAAVDTVEIRSRVNGYLDKIYFEVGSKVKKDAKLFLIDPRPFKAALETAEGNLDRSKASLKTSLAEANRQELLKSQSATSAREYDVVMGKVAEAQAAIRSNVGLLDEAKTNLTYTEIVAPFDGRISRNYVSQGNLIAADKTLLTTIVSENPMHLYFEVDERTVLLIKQRVREGKLQSVGDAKVIVQFGLANEQGTPHQAVVDFVDNKVNPATGTIPARAVVDNKDGLYVPGYYVPRVQVDLSTPYKAVLIPDRALGTDQGKRYVYAVNDKKEVEKRWVTVGELYGDLRVVQTHEKRPKLDENGEMVKDEAGNFVMDNVEVMSVRDRIIVDGMQRVRPGLTVEPKEAGKTAKK